MSTVASRIELGTKRFQVNTAALALAAAVTVTPAVVAPMVSQAAPPALSSASSVLTWGFDALDSALIARDNNKPSAAAVGDAPPTPAQLLQYLVQGIATGISDVARGVTVIAGTAVYTALAFTGGLITTVGGFLPGPIGDFIAGIGNAFINTANVIAQAIHVGPYATSAP